jgi:hypothetical protein
VPLATRYRAARTCLCKMEVMRATQTATSNALHILNVLPKRHGMLARTLKQASHLCWRAVTSHIRFAGTPGQQSIQSLVRESVRLASSGVDTGGGSADDTTEK